MALLAAAAAVVASLLAPPPATADTVNTFYAQVYSGTTPYGMPPIFEAQPTPGDGGLPPGTGLQGHAECSEVYDTGTSGPLEPVPGNGGTPLAPGTYHFVSSSCATDPAFPLSLTNTTGQYDLAISGGYWTIAKAATATGGAGTENGATDDGPPTSVTLEAVVIDGSNEGEHPLPGLPVKFSYQLDNGVWNVNVCPPTLTADDGLGHEVARCTLDPGDSAAFYDGTGVWTAAFAGNADYGPSIFTGQLPGQTTAAAATASLAQIATEGRVTLVAQYVPPECDNPINDIDSDSIIGAGLSTLSCSQLQVLQTITGVVLGLIVPGAEGTDEAMEVAEIVAYNVAVDECNAAKQAFLDSIEVSDPLGGHFPNPDSI